MFHSTSSILNVIYRLPAVTVETKNNFCFDLITIYLISDQCTSVSINCPSQNVTIQVSVPDKIMQVCYCVELEETGTERIW